MPHKHEDLKITAVRYYLNNNVSYAETCRIFDCPERSLKRWIERYEEEDEIKRRNRLPVSYKITQTQIDYAIRRLRENEQITTVVKFYFIKKNRTDNENELYKLATNIAGKAYLVGGHKKLCEKSGILNLIKEKR